jgi:hypothetical protein
MTTESRRTEEFKVSGAGLKAKLKEIIRKGTVRRVVIKNAQGRTVLDIPLAAGVVGAALLPFWSAALPRWRRTTRSSSSTRTRKAW